MWNEYVDDVLETCEPNNDEEPVLDNELDKLLLAEPGGVRYDKLFNGEVLVAEVFVVAVVLLPPIPIELNWEFPMLGEC